MKKLLLVAISLVAVNAFATKARVAALGASSFNVVDSYGIFTNPLRVHQFSNLVTLETGETNPITTAGSTNAEGLFYYTLTEKARIAVAMGNNDAMAQTGRTFMNAEAGSTYATPQNMLHLFYGLNEGETQYAGGIFLSNFDDKTNVIKESSNGLSLGMKNGVNSAYVTLGLSNTAEAGGKKLDAGGYTKLSLRTTQMDMMLGLDVTTWKAKQTDVSSSVEEESYASTGFSLKVAKSNKNDTGSEVFYGANINQQTVDCKTDASATCSSKFTRTTIPLFIGMEVNAADWLVVRGSVTQPLMDSYKDDATVGGISGGATVPGSTGAALEYGAGPNKTTVAAGVGLKFNKLMIDGTLFTAAKPQTLDSSNLMSQVGMTYNF